MALHGEAGWREVEEGAGAAFHFEDAVAGGADEMVVVALAGAFVARGGAGDVDGHEFAGFEQVLDGAVDGGQAEAGFLAAGMGEDFTGAQGAVDGVEDF